MKRKIVYTLPLLLGLCAGAAACAGTETAPVPETNAASTAETQPETDAEGDVPVMIPDSLPERDLNGYRYRILGWEDMGISSIWTEAETGSAVDDAVYRKCRTVEERFNCRVVLADGSGGKGDAALIRNAVRAGDDAYDITQYHDITLAGIVMEGLCLNAYSVPYLDFTKPWWPKYSVGSLTVGTDKMYLFSCHLSYRSMLETFGFFFNKKLLTDYDMEYPYQTVKDGKWTFDVLNEMTKQGYADLNGSGTIDSDDRFGVIQPNFYGVLECFNDEPYRSDAEGNFTYDFNTDYYQTIVEKLFSLFCGQGGKYTGSAEAYDIFANGRALFTYVNFDSAIGRFGSTDLTYGVVPMPKLDEEQEAYYAGCNDKPLAIPVTAEAHLEETGLVTEALSAEGYRQVYPVFFEQALKSRYSDQNEDAEMYDIIVGNKILSFTYIFGDNQGPFNTMLGKLLGGSSPNTNVASYAESIRKPQEKRMQKLTKAFSEMED